MRYFSLENLVDLIKVSPEDILIVVGEIRNSLKKHIKTREKQIYFDEKAVLAIKKYLEVQKTVVRGISRRCVSHNPAEQFSRSKEMKYRTDRTEIQKTKPGMMKLLNIFEKVSKELFQTRKELDDVKKQNMMLKDDVSLLLIENHRLLDQRKSIKPVFKSSYWNDKNHADLTNLAG